MPRKVRKKRRLDPSSKDRQEATHMNHVWSYDFMFDELENGRRLKFLTVVDEYTRESLEIYVDHHITSIDVIEVLKQLIAERDAPSFIRSDNGSEFIAHAIKRWVKEQGMQTLYIEPGSPWQNAYSESFNAQFRRECLNRELFCSLLESRVITQDWRKEYNEFRPHGSLNGLTPKEFAGKEKKLTRYASL